jgi:hypothetical protein
MKQLEFFLGNKRSRQQQTGMIVFSIQTPPVCSPLNMKDHVTNPHTATGQGSVTVSELEVEGRGKCIIVSG